jgi:hypothetical protein
MESQSFFGHDKSSFYCVKCSNEFCGRSIPLLEYDSEKLLKSPTEFRARCPFCDHSNLYSNEQIVIGLVRRMKKFEPAEGFRNARPI